jgi:serine/threonine protein kinase
MEKYGKIIKTLGSGAYGIVHLYDTNVAVKKSYYSDVCVSKDILMEILVLGSLNHRHIIRLMDLISIENKLYVVYDYGGTSLENIVYKYDQLPIDFVRTYTFELISAVNFCHNHHLYHRDITPTNILIDKPNHVLLIDFGSARFSLSQSNRIETDYDICTRSYRAPELLINSRDYNASVDMWSIGCVLAFMLKREHIFNTIDINKTLKLIYQLIGSPINDCFRKKIKQRFQDLRSNLVKRRQLRKLKRHSKYLPTLSYEFRHNDSVAVDLMSKLLVLDSNHRLTSTQALNHDFFNNCQPITYIPTYESLRYKPLNPIDNMEKRKKYIDRIFDIFNLIFKSDILETYHALYASINLCDLYFYRQKDICWKIVIAVVSIMSNLYMYNLISNLNLIDYKYGLPNLLELQIHVLKVMGYKLYYPNPAIELSLHKNQLTDKEFESALFKLKQIIYTSDIFKYSPINIAKMCY